MLLYPPDGKGSAAAGVKSGDRLRLTRMPSSPCDFLPKRHRQMRSWRCGRQETSRDVSHLPGVQSLISASPHLTPSGPPPCQEWLFWGLFLPSVSLGIKPSTKQQEFPWLKNCLLGIQGPACPGSLDLFKFSHRNSIGTLVLFQMTLGCRK